MKTHNKWIYYLIVILLLSVLAIVGAYATKVYSKKVETPVTVTGPVVIHQIALANGVATPNELAIKLGEKIQLNSRDGKLHEISTGKGNDYGNEHDHTVGELSSGTFGADEGYIISFTKTGTYFFHDHFNPNEFITIVVYNPEHT
jgi:plastocyanin